MNIHEYQAKVVLRQFGVPVPRGLPVLHPGDAEAARHIRRSESATASLVPRSAPSAIDAQDR